MSIWNKVLVGLVLVVSLAFFFMAARTLQTHKHWRENARQHDKRIQEVQKQNRELIEGQGEGKDYQPGIRDLRLELQKKLANRGRVWKDCKPVAGQQPQNAAGQVVVATDARGIDQKTVLYVFDDGDARQAGAYLGEFKAVNVDQAKNLVTLLPSMTLAKEELQRLAASAAGNRAWIMYEIMPADGHEAFAHLDQEQLKKLLPANRVEEYLKDGKLLTTDEVERLGLEGRLVAVDEGGHVMYVDQGGKTLYASGVDASGRLVYVDEKGKFSAAAAVQKKVDAAGEVVYDVEYFDENGQALAAASVLEKQVENGKGRYLRRLRDYDVLLRSYRLQRSILIDLGQAAARDLAYVVSALAEAEEQQKFREREKALLIAEKDKVHYQRSAVDGLLLQLRREVKSYQDAIDRLVADNLKMAADIDVAQQEAKRRIDARTGSMAQSGVGETR